MLVVRSYDTDAFPKERPVRVRSVLPRSGWRSRQVAIVEVSRTPGGAALPFAMWRRAGYRWRPPRRAGRRQEVLAHALDEAAAEAAVRDRAFRLPDRGSAVCYLYDA